MSDTKNKKKSILLVAASTILLLFLGYNIYWYNFYKPFKSWSDSCAFEDSCKYSLGTSYSKSDENHQATYFLSVPSYLGNFGQAGVSQWLKINDDPQSEYKYNQDMKYSVSLQVDKTISKQKKYQIRIILVKGVKKNSEDQEYIMYVDENMNVLSTDNYSESELKYYEDCKDTIEELNALLKSFYGEDNINDL